MTRSLLAAVLATTLLAACSSSSDDGGGQQQQSLCDQYCTNAQANCTGANAIYTSPAACQTACAAATTGASPAVPTNGTTGATSGNTLQCRIYHLGTPAAGAPATHCPHGQIVSSNTIGGPADGPCAPPQLTACEVYCNAVAASCTAATDNPYSGLTGTCLDVCNTRAAWPATGAANSNSLSCRTTHAQLAASPGPPAVHCPHAGPTGGGVCGNSAIAGYSSPAQSSYCDNYCYLALRNCTGANVLYADAAACQTACNGLTVGTVANATTGNSVQCRINHLLAASATPAVHCPHGSAASTAGTCQ